MDEWSFTKLIYSRPLLAQDDVRDFIMEGQGYVSFPEGRLRMENILDPSEGQKSNFVFWCPEEFPSDILVTWDFWPVREPGLCMLFFAAKGANGEDLFDKRLNARNGEYPCYNNGDINTLHAAYFRRRYPEERAFHLCNLRKSKGFNLVCQGADPIPDVDDANPPYNIKLIKQGPEVAFYINDLMIYYWKDDGFSYGPELQGGKIGFRQMAPFIGEYANLKVYTI